MYDDALAHVEAERDRLRVEVGRLRALADTLREELEGRANVEGTNGVLGSYHAQLDALGAPPHRWPCIRVGKLVEGLRAEMKAAQRELATASVCPHEGDARCPIVGSAA